MAAIYNEPVQNKDHIFLKKRIFKILAAMFLLLFSVLIRMPENIRGYGYSLFREMLKISSICRAGNLSVLEGKHFVVKYPRDVDEADASLILNTAEEFYAAVNKDYNFSMSRKIPVIVYNSKEELNRFFGWPASESTMGVYWAGVICVLSPKVWIEETDPGRLKDVFVQSGPMAHEYTHLVVDYKTRGNYPRWFTEGLAQYEEYKLTGFRFTNSEGSLQQKLYSLQELKQSFDYLPNQSLAYRQSLSVIEFLVHTRGENIIQAMLDSLSRGKNMDEALKEIAGIGMQDLEQEWRQWVSLNQFK